MNEELKIILSADVGGFVDGVLKVNRSIGELETELKQFQKEIKTLKGDEFNVMSDKIKTLKANISALKSAGTSSIPPLADDLKKIAAPAGNAGFALSNLGRVASDLPFGFIAIQNNLSPLLESFQGLKKESGSTGGALKALGGSLIGAGGLGFAFAAIPAIITSVIQKYGSLDNALQTLFASNKAAAESQALFNKEFAKGFETFGGEEAKIKVLVNTLTNLKEPYRARQAAYEELKKVQPDILAGISKENALNGTASGIIKNNAAQRIELLKLKIEESAITSVLNAQKIKENELTDKKIAADTALADTRAKINKLSDKALSASQQNTLEILIGLEKSQTATVQSLGYELANVTKVSDVYYERLNKNSQSVSELDLKTQLLIEGDKKLAKAESDAAKATSASISESNKKTTALKEQKTRVDELLTSLQKQGVQAPVKNFEAQPQTALSQAGTVQAFQGSPIKDELLSQAFAANQAKEAYQKYAEVVANIASPAIDGFFSAISSGKDAFTALGDSIKALVIDLVKAIIKATILKAITTAVSGGAGAGVFGVLSGLLQGGLGGIAAPSFGGGVSAGGFSLNGQVTFIQRGGDLVGVLNNSNKMINRVG